MTVSTFIMDQCVLSDIKIYNTMATSLIFRVLSTVAASSATPITTSMFLGTAQCTGVAAASSSLGQGSHELGDLLFQFSCFLH